LSPLFTYTNVDYFSVSATRMNVSEHQGFAIVLRKVAVNRYLQGW